MHDAGGLVIVDEVQTGFGRCGEHFWVHQTYGKCHTPSVAKPRPSITYIITVPLGVHPDILTMGKPMANGHPISGVATRKELVKGLAEKCGPKMLEEVGDYRVILFGLI